MSTSVLEPGDATDDARDDAAWVSRIRDGDPLAFDAMFRAFTEQLQRFARRYVRSTDIAAEIVQEVFLRLWRSPRHFDHYAQLKAYLHRAARNLALDHLEREAVRQRGHEDILIGSIVDGSRAHIALAYHDAELAELVATIDAVLAEMPERRRAVCTLRWKHGRHVAEIAAELGIAPKTVEIQIGRGLKQLRARLER